MSAADVRLRAGHARAFLAAAVLVDELGDAAEISPRTNIVGSLAVLAGIAASDAICGHRLAEKAAGENHSDAVRILQAACRPGRDLSKNLQRLLDAKSNTHYAATDIGERRARELVTSTTRLVEGMDAILAA